MAKVVDLIKDNAELLMRLRNSGYRNIDNLTDAFCVYQIYLSFDNIKEKMEHIGLKGMQYSNIIVKISIIQ